ncbi:MAG: hypothetical protein LW832_00965 [Parachlamydia sp.]|jgi:hypothetical protein|nr:hypothetical protein [Parachlamydia sp.]
MPSLSLGLEDLQKINVELDQPIVNYNKIGTLIGESRYNHYICGWITGQTQPRLVEIINQVKGLYGQLENQAVKIYAEERQAEGRIYREKFVPYFKFIEAIEREISRLPSVSPALKKAQRELGKLKVSLRYRIGASNGGVDPLDRPDAQQMQKLEEYLLEWKRGQPLTRNNEINLLEREALGQAACYPEFVDLLEDTAYRKEFMSWAIRQWLPVDAFIQFDSKKTWIKDSLMSSALGHARSNVCALLKVEQVATKTEGIVKKILSLPIYNGNFRLFESAKQKRISLLKPEKEVFFEKGSALVTVKEIMRQWSLKNDKETNFALCQWGIINFHPTFGPFNAPSQTYNEAPSTWPRQNWMDLVPPARVLTQVEMEQRYGREKMLGRTLIIEACAARTHRDLTAIDCHGFWKINYRMPDGNWKVCYPGPFGERYAVTTMDKIRFFCGCLKFAFVHFDQNQYLPQRERAILPLCTTQAEEEVLLESIYRLMVNDGIFQFSGRNCAYYVQKAAQCALPHIGELYKVPITVCRTKIRGIDSFLSFVHNRADWLKSILLWFFHRGFGSHRGLSYKEPLEGGGFREVYYSTSDFFKEEGNNIYNPANLFELIEEGKRNQTEPYAHGQIYWTPTEERLLRPL